MRDIRFETGVEEFSVNGRGCLRFNPADPGLYGRYMDFYKALEAVVERYRREAAGPEGDEAAQAARLLDLTRQADGELKQGLAGVFGDGNDFDALLEGVNLLATTAGGTTVVQNLLEALLPVVREAAAARQDEMRRRAAEAQEEQRTRQALRGTAPADG